MTDSHKTHEELDEEVQRLTAELASRMTPEQASAESKRLRERRREAAREESWLFAVQLALDEEDPDPSGE